MVFFSDPGSETSAKIKPFLGRERIKVAEKEKNPKMNTTKQNYCDLRSN